MSAGEQCLSPLSMGGEWEAIGDPGRRVIADPRVPFADRVKRGMFASVRPGGEGDGGSRDQAESSDQRRTLRDGQPLSFSASFGRAAVMSAVKAEPQPCRVDRVCEHTGWMLLVVARAPCCSARTSRGRVQHPRLGVPPGGGVVRPVEGDLELRRGLVLGLLGTSLPARAAGPAWSRRAGERGGDPQSSALQVLRCRVARHACGRPIVLCWRRSAGVAASAPALVPRPAGDASWLASRACSALLDLSPSASRPAAARG
jgi:hypothetical protein